ncbi:hypothetical protein [Streptomyces sp. KR80]|uniref:hypothetical protein n=1 Tax=Streptomyces sp. KR80 TaxID=3457426 RepID=UPI003FD2B4C1
MGRHRRRDLPDLSGDLSDEEHALLAEQIVASRIDGPVFFAGAHRFLPELSEVADTRVVILRMSGHGHLSRRPRGNLQHGKASVP